MLQVLALIGRPGAKSSLCCVLGQDTVSGEMFGSLGVIFEEKLTLKNIKIFVAKALMSSYILCKILSIYTRIAQKVFHTSHSNSLGQLIVLCPFNIQY